LIDFYEEDMRRYFLCNF